MVYIGKVEWSGSVAFEQRNGLLRLAAAGAFQGRHGGMGLGWSCSRSWRRRRSFLPGHKVVNTVALQVVCDTCPFTAITWSEACPRRKLPSLGDVGHAVALEQVQIGSRVNGHVDGRVFRINVSGFVGSFKVIGFVAGATARSARGFARASRAGLVTNGFATRCDGVSMWRV